jgi:hypothetical protein
MWFDSLCCSPDAVTEAGCSSAANLGGCIVTEGIEKYPPHENGPATGAATAQIQARASGRTLDKTDSPQTEFQHSAHYGSVTSRARGTVVSNCRANQAARPNDRNRCKADLYLAKTPWAKQWLE